MTFFFCRLCTWNIFNIILYHSVPADIQCSWMIQQHYSLVQLCWWFSGFRHHVGGYQCFRGTHRLQGWSPHGITTQKTNFDIFTSMTNSTLTTVFQRQSEEHVIIILRHTTLNYRIFKTQMPLVSFLNVVHVRVALSVHCITCSVMKRNIVGKCWCRRLHKSIENILKNSHNLH